MIGFLLFAILIVAGYYGFFSVPSPTTLAVAEQISQPKAVPAQEPEVIVEEKVDEKNVLEQVSENALASNSLWVYNTEDGSIVDMLQVGVSPVSVQLSPNGWWAFVLNAGSKSVSVIDVQSSSIVHTISLGGEPRTMRLSPSGELLAVVTFSNAVLLFDTKNFVQVGSMQVGKKPSDVIFSPEGKYVFVTSEKNNMFEKVNPYLGHSISLAEVGKSPVAIALTSKDRAFIVNSASETVSVIDVIDMSRAKKYDIPAGSKPVDIILDSKEQFAYVANKDSNSVTVFDSKTFKSIYEIAVGKSPVALAYNSHLDSDIVYVANDGSDEISVIDVQKKEVVSHWKSGVRPSSLAVSKDGKFLFATMRGKNVLS